MFLSAAPLLSPEDLQLFSQGLSSAWDGSCDEVLKDAVYRLASRAEPKGHVVLILDKVRVPPPLSAHPPQGSSHDGLYGGELRR